MDRIGSMSMNSKSSEYSELEEKILAYGYEINNGDVNGNGVNMSKVLTQQMLYDRFNAKTLDDKKNLIVAVNKLSKARRMEMQRSITGEIEYVMKTEEHASKYLGLTEDHMKVIQEIKLRGNRGIFKRELKQITGFLPCTLTRLIKTLESRNIIKAVKTITSKNMNLYMMSEIAPSREQTGGPWYTDQVSFYLAFCMVCVFKFCGFAKEFDVALVEKLSGWMYKAIKGNENRNGAETTLSNMAKHLNDSKVLTVELSVSDLKLLMKKLVYENKIEPIAKQKHLPFEHWTWKLSAPVRSFNYLPQTPCGVCPVIERCTVGGVISPTTCQYMKPWLTEATKGAWKQSMGFEVDIEDTVVPGLSR